MQNVFIKAYLAEEATWFYTHYRDDWAIEQVEISPNGKIFLSEDNLTEAGSMLPDQPFDRVNEESCTFIDEEEFYRFP